MLRSDHNIPNDARRVSEWGGSWLASKLRGTLTIDSADLVLNKATGILVGTSLGIPMYRDSALANGKFVYKDSAGNTLATNV